jgi:hypothetical protein
MESMKKIKTEGCVQVGCWIYLQETDKPCLGLAVRKVQTVQWPIEIAYEKLQGAEK